VSISASATGSHAISEWLTRSRASATISSRSASSASRSSVTLIDPSSEFSIGTIAHSRSLAHRRLTTS